MSEEIGMTVNFNTFLRATKVLWLGKPVLAVIGN